MNAREAKKRREAEEQEFRHDILALVESQKGVIGALVRKLDALEADMNRLRRTSLYQSSALLQ